MNFKIFRNCLPYTDIELSSLMNILGYLNFSILFHYMIGYWHIDQLTQLKSYYILYTVFVGQVDDFYLSSHQRNICGYIKLLLYFDKMHINDRLSSIIFFLVLSVVEKILLWVITFIYTEN